MNFLKQITFVILLVLGISARAQTSSDGSYGSYIDLKRFSYEMCWNSYSVFKMAQCHTVASQIVEDAKTKGTLPVGKEEVKLFKIGLVKKTCMTFPSPLHRGYCFIGATTVLNISNLSCLKYDLNPKNLLDYPRVTKCFEDKYDAAWKSALKECQDHPSSTEILSTY